MGKSRALVYLIVGLLCAAKGQSAHAAEGGWFLVKNADFMTDEVARSLCSRDTENTLVCFSFEQDGKHVEIYIRLVLDEANRDVFAANKWPLLRIDAFKPRSINDVIASEELLGYRLIPRTNESDWISWRVQAGTPAKYSNAKGFFAQISSGQTLKIRSFIHGGRKLDSTVSLYGLGPLLAAELERTKSKLTPTMP